MASFLSQRPGQQSRTLPDPGHQYHAAHLLHLSEPLALEHGGSLKDPQLAYALSGPEYAPLVVVMGGISSHRHVAHGEGPDQKGWWPQMVGPGLGVDTEEFRVLGFDFLGGNGLTTGPRQSDGDFPSISTRDQARCLKALLDHLEVEKVHGIIGSSYGGMVGLAFAEAYPDRLERLVVLSAADRPDMMAQAWRCLQRRMVKLGEQTDGLALSRALAMTTYRSRREFNLRFDGAPRATEAGFVFPVEDYLLSRGEAFVDRFDPNAFLCLSESIDLHRVSPERVTAPVTLIAVTTDRLVPLEDMRRLRRELAGAGELIEINSLYGHDAFLKEPELLSPILTRALQQEQVT